MRRNKLYLSMLCCSLAIPLSAVAQDDEAVEEIVVTGSYIKRDKFDMASPVETIDAVEIQQSGYSSIGPYIKDLTYTQNVDTTANILDVADGQQDSVSAQFNLRGLGTSSTLTLLDGHRVVTQNAVAAILPDIAMRTVDIILDGGAATYGTDAVAGVVNLIPIKEYDGAKMSFLYSRPETGEYYEPKIQGIFGKTYDRFNFVTAFSWYKLSDHFMRGDRPEYLRADNDSSITGNPGNFALGSPTGTALSETGCGQGNTGFTDDGLNGSYPGGFNLTIYCGLEYGQWQANRYQVEDRVAYFYGEFDVTEDFSVYSMLNMNNRITDVPQSPSTGERAANMLTRIPFNHPNQAAARPALFPTGAPFDFFPLIPVNWRPFSANGATQPSYLNDHNSQEYEYDNKSFQLRIGGEYNLGGSWFGKTDIAIGQESEYISGHYLNLDNLTLALRGEGGESGTEWFNPFYSASINSPDYVDCITGTGAGCSANSQSLVDWLFVKDSFENEDRDYSYFQTYASGDLFELPAGAVQSAFGIQYRKIEFTDGGNILERMPSAIHLTASEDGGPASQNYNSAPINGVYQEIQTESAVFSAFGEAVVPILDNLELNVAARYENFDDIGISKTVPKLSLLYQPSEQLSLRASVGTGFVAPTNFESTEQSSPACAELFSGTDPVLGTSLIGGLSCINGNPDVGPEESTILNAGFTFKPIDELSISLDYQTIQYEDRILCLSSTDTLNLDFANLLDNEGLDQTGWDALTPADQLARTLAWQASGNQDPTITRNATTGAVERWSGGANCENTSQCCRS
ncbi:TonB-dependent receptor plug domain-containing protein [Aurantivibrio plasticivorans]